MGFPIGHLFSIRSFLLVGAQISLFLENNLLATSKRSKETNSDFIARILSVIILISNVIQLKGR